MSRVRSFNTCKNNTGQQVPPFKILHLNAQSATNKLDELTLLCNELKPDIFVVSEHGFPDDTINCFKIDNYTLAASYQRMHFKWGGVAIFTRPQIDYSLFKTPENIDLDFEVKAIKITSNPHNNLIVVGLYRSPNGCINSFFQKLDILLNSLLQKKLKFICIGDFNINVIDNTNPHTKRFRDILGTYGLRWSINSPTRVTQHTSSAIDNVVTNIEGVSVSVLDVAISDHFAQEVGVPDFTPIAVPPKVSLKRVAHPQNIKMLHDRLTKMSWDFLQDYDNPDSRFEAFQQALIFNLDSFCPFKKKKIQQNKKSGNCNWITKGILKSRDKLHFYQKIYRTTQNDTFKDFFKTYKRIYKRVVRAAKAYEINKALAESDNISKTAWKIINNICKSEKSQNSNMSLRIGKKIIDQPLDVASEFNSFFASVATVDSPQRTSSRVQDPPNLLTSMVLNPVSVEEVARVMHGLRAKKSCDVDGLSPWLLKQIANPILAPLTELINFSFKKGIFPTSLKTAKITPILKKGDPLVPSNYRPISILPVLSKVFEKLYLNQFQGFLDKYEILSPNQFGFRQNKCTIDAISNLVEYIVDGLERREHVLSIFLDLSKAFDCVHHKTLLLRLEGCGIRGLPLKWIASYLSDRYQCVQVSNVVSPKVRTTHGVPQGSVLGPVLFLVYVNHIEQSIQHGKITQYADDTTLCLKSKTLDDLELNSYLDVNSCIQFFSQINLETNNSKSNVTHFRPRGPQSVSVPVVLVNDEILKSSESTKFLGMYLDGGLTWNEHVEQLCKKMTSGIFALRSLAQYCSSSVLKMAYYGLIYPHLVYGIRLWGSCSKKNLERVFKLQKKAIRIIAGLKYRESCKNTFRELGILTLPCLYVYEVVVFCRTKCTLVQGRQVHQYDTRGRDNIRGQNFRLNVSGKLPHHLGVKFINKLPDRVKNTENLNLFRTRLKQLLITEELYTLDEFWRSRWDN